MFTFRFWKYMLAGFVGFAPLSSPLWSQSVELVGEDRISVRARETPIKTLLEELFELVPVEVLVIDPSVEQTPVSVDLQNVRIEEGIRAILEEAGVDYVLWGGNGKPFRVFAGSPDTDLQVGAFTPETDEETGSSHAGDRSATGEVTLEPQPVPQATQPLPATGEATLGPQPFPPAAQPLPATGEATLGPQPFPPAAQPRPATGGATLGPQPVPRAVPQPRRPQSAQPQPGQANKGGVTVTGTAIPATGGAGLLDRPDTTRVALTAGLLGLGLLFGMALVRDPEHEKHQGKAKRRRWLH